MTNKEIQELKERVYAISYSGFPLDSFFNDIEKNDNPRFNKDLAYKDLKLIIDKIYDLREKAKKYNEKETPKKFEIIDRDLIFHSTPQPTKYYLNIRCSCGEEFGCIGYQHWKVIDKNNVEKDYFEYEYSYCPHCGNRLEY